MLKGPYLWPTATDRFFEANTQSIRSAKTREAFEGTYRRLHQSFTPPKRIEQYSENDLVGYLNGGKDPRTGVRWAPETVLRNRTALRSLFSWAYHEGLVKADPSSYLHRLVRPRRLQVREADHHWLGEDEVLEVLAACEGPSLRDARDRACLALGFFTGLRASEIAALRWNNVHREYIAVVDGKGGKSAQVPLVGQLRAVLLSWRTEAPGALQGPVLCRFRSYAAGGPGEPMTEHPERNIPLTGQGVWAITKRRGELAGYPGLRPHDMRRTFAGILQAKGFPIEQISEALRHDNVGTTQRYLAKNPGRLRDAMREFRIG